MGRHVVRSLLLANRPDGWEFVEKLLVAAQRQEGLRQTILECVDEAHPIAYQRMLKLILDENLIRFAATLRAVDVWFGFDLDVLQEKQARSIVAQVLEFRTDTQQQQAALASDDAQIYLALWSIAFTDALQAIESAKSLLQHPEASHRLVAVHCLNQLDLHPARMVILGAIEDPDARVAWLALRLISTPNEELLAAKNTLQRQAGLDLLAELAKNNRLVDKCRSIAQTYRAERGEKITNVETQLLERIFVRESQPATLRDALGLVNLADLFVPEPVTCSEPVELNTAAAKHTLLAIDELIHQHRQTPIQIPNYQNEIDEELLGNLTWRFPSIYPKLSRSPASTLKTGECQIHKFSG